MSSFHEICLDFMMPKRRLTHKKDRQGRSLRCITLELEVAGHSLEMFQKTYMTWLDDLHPLSRTK